MAKTYQVTWVVRFGNTITSTLHRAGVPMGNMRLLTVKGRKSGVARTVPVALGEQRGQRFLMSPFGEVQWVRNLRAAGEGVLTRGRSVEHVLAVEAAPAEAAHMLKESLVKASAFLRHYFNVTPASTLAEFEREAPRHPVFLISSSLDWGTAQ